MSATWYGPPGQPCECPNLAGDCDGAHGTDVQSAIAGMLARRYSAQPTQRDLDVANIAAAAERERILVSDETLHADGSIGPDMVPEGFSQDPAYWYRRWLFAMKQLDKEAIERIHGFADLLDPAGNDASLAPLTHAAAVDRVLGALVDERMPPLEGDTDE